MTIGSKILVKITIVLWFSLEVELPVEVVTDELILLERDTGLTPGYFVNSDIASLIALSKLLLEMFF